MTSRSVNCPIDCKTSKSIGSPAINAAERAILRGLRLEIKAMTTESISHSAKNISKKGMISISDGILSGRVLEKITSNASIDPPIILSLWAIFISHTSPLPSVFRHKILRASTRSNTKNSLEPGAVNALIIYKLFSAYCPLALTDRSRNL